MKQNGGEWREVPGIRGYKGKGNENYGLGKIETRAIARLLVLFLMAPKISPAQNAKNGSFLHAIVVTSNFHVYFDCFYKILAKT